MTSARSSSSATGLVALALGLLFAVPPQGARGNEPPRLRPEANLTVRSPAGGFRLISPDATWMVERRKVGPRHVRLAHGAEASLEVRITPLRRPHGKAAQAEPPGPEALLHDLALRRRLQVDRQGSTQLGGLPAWEMISSRRGLAYKHVLAIHAGQVYLVEAQASRLSFARYAGIFDDIIRTFVFVPPG